MPSQPKHRIGRGAGAGEAGPLRARPARASLASALLLLQLAGCYTYAPTAGQAVPVGAEVHVGVTDRGRVELTEPVGPGVRTIQGQVLASTDSSLVLAVQSVHFLDLAVPARWKGERVELGRDIVAEVRERRLSRTRSWLAGGLVAAAVLAVTTVGIAGFGTGDTQDKPDPGDGDQS